MLPNCSVRLVRSVSAFFLAVLTSLPVCHVTNAVAAPDNDSFAGAREISGTSGTSAASNIGATREAGEPYHWPTTQGSSVWWRWTAPATGWATFAMEQASQCNLCLYFESVVAVYTGSSIDALTQIISNNGRANGLAHRSRTSFYAMTGQTYYIAIDAIERPGTDEFDLEWSLDTSEGSTGLLAAVLPYARSTTLDRPASAFATLLNTSDTPAIGCSIQMPAGLSVSSLVQFRAATTTNVIDPAFALNQPVDIAANNSRNFVFAITPAAAFSADIPLVFFCQNRAPAPTQVGLNTFALSASATAKPDLLTIGATPSGDGIVTIPGEIGTTLFAAAAVNIGAAGSITATVDDGGRGLSATVRLCLSDPITAACINPPATSISFFSTLYQTLTLTVEITATGPIAFDPANNRLFLRFKSTDGITRGATSVAVRTHAADSTADAKTSQANAGR